MKKNIVINFLGMAIATFFSASLLAQSPTAPALGFNVFVKNGGSFYSSETEGPVAIGGDLTIGGSYAVSAHNKFSYKLNNINIGLLVAGKVNYRGGSSFQVLNNGYVLIGNQNGSKAWYKDPNNAFSPIRITPGSDYNGAPNIALSANSSNLGVSATVNPIFQASPINFSDAFTKLQANATAISGLTDNALIYNSPNQGVSPIAHKNIPSNTQIYIKTLSLGVTTLNIAGADLNNFQSLTFSGQKPDATHLLVINVNAPGSYTWNACNNGGIGGTEAAYILYNFYNTTSLNIGGYGSIEGTVFAPFADISKSSNNSNVEGQVIGQSYIQTAGGEIHSYNFNSTVISGISAPTTLPTALSFDYVDLTTISSKWTNGNGSNRVVIVSKSPITTLPTNGKAYTANTSFGVGDAVAGGFVVYNGTGSNVVVTNLTPNQLYYFAVVEYNGTGANIIYATGSLTGSATTLADSDSDGVADINDAYPNDASRAFNNYYPSAGFGTYMFEDNWPGTGDYDFNDVVMSYRYNTVTNAANKVVELKATLVTRAVGASFKNGFGIQLDNLAPSLVTKVGGVKTAATSWLAVDANGTEANQTFANVVVIDNISRILPPSSDGFVNTVVGTKVINADTTNVTIGFVADKVNTNDFAINPYLIINDNRSRELHFANRLPTSKADKAYFGTADDKTSPASGFYYKNAKNIPWALDIPAFVPYAIEGKDITTAYLNLVNWAQSNGGANADWYLDKSGNRNTTNLFSK